MKKEKPIIYEEKEIDILRIIGVLYRYKWFIIIVTGCSAIVIFLYLLIASQLPLEESYYPDVYRSTATVLVNEKSTNEIIASLFTPTGLSSGGLFGDIPLGFSFGELTIKIIRSRSILDIIADEFDIINRHNIDKSQIGISRQLINNHLSVSYDEKTMTITIGYEDYNPEFARDVVTRFVELLEEKYLLIGGSRYGKQKDLLESKLLEVEGEISALEYKIQEFQKDYGVLDVDSLAIEQAAIMSRFRSQLILKEIEIKTYSDFATIEDPTIRQLRAERDNLLSLINEIESGFSEYENILPSQKDLPDISLEFNHLKRDLSIKEKIYEILIQQYELIKLTLEGGDQIFQVLEQAEVPDFKVGPNRALICLFVTFVAFSISCLLVFIFKAIKNILNDPESVRKLKGLD